MEDTSTAVLTAINHVTQKAGSVAKTGENKFHGYNYATAADIAHKLQPLMAEAGLVIIQSQKEAKLVADGQLMAVEYEFTLAHITGAQWPEKPVYTGVSAAKNSKGGFDDKAVNKCHTAARKYFLLSLFHIPTGDYDDADKEADLPPSQASQAPLATPKQAETIQAATAPKNKPYHLITVWGEELTFEKGSEYLKAMEDEFAKCNGDNDRLGFWESNSEHFQEWQTKAIQAADKDGRRKPTADAFCATGKLICDQVHAAQQSIDNHGA